MLPNVFINPEDPYPRQVGTVDVDEVASGATATLLTSFQPTPRALAVAVTLMRSMARHVMSQDIGGAPPSSWGFSAFRGRPCRTPLLT